METALRVDLHAHSNASDGTLTPADLHAAMAEAGMTLVALTDHDTLAGVRALRAAGRGTPEGSLPRVLAGIEVNTDGHPALDGRGLGRAGRELHVLGYGMDPDDPALDAVLARQRDGRRARIAEMLARLRADGRNVALTEDELAALPADAVGRPHLARALVAGGEVASVDEAFATLLRAGSPYWVPRRGLDTRAAIEAIVAAGGVAVLAHPAEADAVPDAIDRMRDWGLAGLEVHYPRFAPERVGALAAFAATRGLLATGGTDFHGDTETYGAAAGRVSVPPAAAERLLEAIAA